MSTLLFLSWLIGFSLGLEVRQSHSDLITNPGDKVEIFCSHNKTDYRMMLWYQRSPGDTTLKLIGYLNFKNVKIEKLYEVFSISGDLSGSTTKTGSLIIKQVSQEQSAVYYCAARDSRGDANEAYFGKGTKLTVLGTGYEVKTPSVTVLKPAENECRNKKDEERKKTLLCVATGFYPDHVTVFWQVDGENVTRGVATDNEARLVDKTYTITSRLRVSHDIWFTPGKKFTCIVNFFNSKTYKYYHGSTFGDEDKGKLEVAAHETRDGFLKIKQKAKLSYAVIIAKSILYGAFVVFLAWKLKGSTSKY